MPTSPTAPSGSPAWGDNAEGLEGIAPALVITAEYDRLRGVDHGYDIMSDATGVTERMYALITKHVTRATAR